LTFINGWKTGDMKVALRAHKQTQEVHMTLQRRTILKRAGIAAALLTLGHASHAQSAAAIRRPSVYGPIGLELEGRFAGWVDSFMGGDLIAEVLAGPTDPTGVTKKHVANIAVNDIVLTAGNWMSSAFYEWIRETLARGTPRRSGAILTFDNQFRPVARLEFGNATLKEVSFPALDASSREAAYFTVRIAPEQLRTVAPNATVPASPAKGRSSWHLSNFHVSVDNVDTSSVAAIEALTFTQTITTDFRGRVVSVAFTEPDLAMTQAGAGTFGPWVDDFFVQGNHLDRDERSGSLTLLGPNLMDVLFTLTFSHLGIVRVGTTSPAKAGEPMATRAQLYMEDMQFDFKPTW
jgi:hypothetical protein